MTKVFLFGDCFRIQKKLMLSRSYLVYIYSSSRSYSLQAHEFEIFVLWHLCFGFMYVCTSMHIHIYLPIV